MKSFVKMFFSNDEVLKARKFNIFVIILLFFINVSLISVPNFMGRMESVNTIDHLYLIEEAFSDLYDLELDCQIENQEMNCDIEDNINVQGYDVIYSEEYNLDGIDSSVIYFSKTEVAIIYVDETDTAYNLLGNYRLLDGLDFSTISSEDAEDEEVTDNILSAIYFSTLDQYMSLIYVGQFIQTFIYISVVSSMFMLMNFKAKVKKLKYINSLKIIISSMTGPALLVALVALIEPGIASLLFFIIYAIRAMLIYYKMNFSDQTYVD